MPPFLSDRFAVWQLADYCGWLGKEPSEVLHLSDMRLGRTVIWDFNMAVRTLKRLWDARQEEQIWVVDTERHDKPRKPVPKYRTIFEVLGLNKDGTVPVRTRPDTVQKLAAEVRAGTVDWSAYGYE